MLEAAIRTGNMPITSTGNMPIEVLADHGTSLNIPEQKAPRRNYFVDVQSANTTRGPLLTGDSPPSAGLTPIVNNHVYPSEQRTASGPSCTRLDKHLHASMCSSCPIRIIGTAIQPHTSRSCQLGCTSWQFAERLKHAMKASLKVTQRVHHLHLHIGNVLCAQFAS